MGKRPKWPFTATLPESLVIQGGPGRRQRPKWPFTEAIKIYSKIYYNRS